MEQQVTNDAAEQQPKPEQEKMFDLIRQQSESDMTVRQFCALHNLPASRYYYWRKKYYETSMTIKLTHRGMIIRYPSYLSIKLNPNEEQRRP